MKMELLYEAAVQIVEASKKGSWPYERQAAELARTIDAHGAAAGVRTFLRALAICIEARMVAARRTSAQEAALHEEDINDLIGLFEATSSAFGVADAMDRDAG